MITDLFVETGRKYAGNVEVPLVKLQAMYKFLEQLYVGGVNCLKAVKNVPGPPLKIIDMLNELSTVPEWIKELKMSACRRGVMSALALTKAYHPEMNPALLVGGFPEFNSDNSPFTEVDFRRVIKETRPAGTTIAHGLDLSGFQATYDEKNRRMDMPQPKPFELIPPHKQQTAESTPSGANSASKILVEEMVFESLASMQWGEANPATNTEEAPQGQEQENPADAEKINLATTGEEAKKS